MLIILAAWWTIAVVMLSWAFTKVEPTPLDTGIIICMSVFWPVTAVALVPYVAYQMLVASTTRIRADLKNRGILREFEQWLADQKEEGKIIPKD
jgi:hypothetical protein